MPYKVTPNMAIWKTLKIRSTPDGDINPSAPQRKALNMVTGLGLTIDKDSKLSSYGYVTVINPSTKRTLTVTKQRDGSQHLVDGSIDVASNTLTNRLSDYDFMRYLNKPARALDTSIFTGDKDTDKARLDQLIETLNSRLDNVNNEIRNLQRNLDEYNEDKHALQHQLKEAAKIRNDID